MDLREQLLPNEKLLTEYTNLFIENKKGNAYLTNRRIFLSTKNNLWNFNTDDIRYMGRMNKPRFSWIWQVLISLMILYSILGGHTLLFLICIILSAARQYLKIDSLEIGLENKKWTIADDNEQLDEMMLQIPTNPDFKSLNLSHSLIIIAQFVSSIINSKMSSFNKSNKVKSASKMEIVSMANLCIQNLEEINFFKSKDKRPIMLENLRNIFYRMELSTKETRILSGVFASLGKKR